MKRLFLLTALLLCLLPVAPVMAQESPADLEWLTVDLWPDYDQPSVLVLLTGGLPSATTFPAEVTVPLPDDATVNAVARISDDNQMIADITFQEEDGSLTLLTPDARFRIEYYMPYQQNGLERSFQFTWQAEMDVNEMDVSVQQPVLATTMQTDPDAEVVTTGEDGLQYLSLPLQSVAAGTTFTADIQYTLGEAGLTVNALPAGSNSGTTAPAAAPATEGSDFNWPLLLAVAGGLLLALALVWQFWGEQLLASLSSRQPQKPRPVRATKRPSSRNKGPSGAPPAARFCHECGQAAQPGDRFCRQCGTRLKGS